MLDKINVWGIVVAHFETFRDSRGERHWPDFIVFIGLPLLFALAGLYWHWALYVDALNAMLAAFSIFAGLLLNLLILVYTFSPANQPYPAITAKARTTFVYQLHSNLAFSVLLSVVIAVIVLICVCTVRMYDTGPTAHTERISTFIIVFLTGNFVLTIFMILKRIHRILTLEIEKPGIKKVS